MSELWSFWSGVPSSIVFLAVVWWLALCGLIAWLAHGKGHNPIGFSAIAFFFSPIIGLLVLIAARDLRNVSEAQIARDTFRQMMGPLALKIDGIRGHLAVSTEAAIMPTPHELPAMRSKVAPLPL
jgi:hypothetical protein